MEEDFTYRAKNDRQENRSERAQPNPFLLMTVARLGTETKHDTDHEGRLEGLSLWGNKGGGGEWEGGTQALTDIIRKFPSKHLHIPYIMNMQLLCLSIALGRLFSFEV